MYTRTENDRHTPEGVCPACSIVYSKWKPVDVQPNSGQDETVYGEAEEARVFERLKRMVLEVPEQVDPLVFWGRSLVFVVFFIWGCWFILAWGDWIKIGSSFLHNINLPFHEFGHVLFGPFGQFMGILGGSLFQVMLPLIVMVVFLRQQDNFEAAIMLWWCGQNFIDLSPYISDAEYRGLPLIMGMGEEGHDWGNLLSMMGVVDKAYLYGKFSFGLGSIIILVALAWGGYILYLQKQNTGPL